MDIRKLSADFSVSPQIAADDVAEIAALGFKSVLCNRPDGEALEQTPSVQIAEQALRCGLEFRLIPVSGCNFTDAAVANFSRALESLPTPILGYCRTGTRSTNLWALALAGKHSPQELISLAKSAGYDLSAIAPRLTAVPQIQFSAPRC